jgi:hypothetical protein
MIGGFNFDSGIEQEDNNLLASHWVNDPVPDDDPGFEIVAGNYADLSSPELLDYSTCRMRLALVSKCTTTLWSWFSHRVEPLIHH